MRKTKTRYNLIMLLILSLVMVTLVPPKIVEARVKHPWVVLNKGTKQEIVCGWFYTGVYGDESDIGFYTCSRPLTIKQAERRGEIAGIYPVREMSWDKGAIPGAYMVAIRQPNYRSLLYRPIKIIREVEVDGQTYAEDANGDRHVLNQTDIVCISKFAFSCSLNSGILDYKKRATTEVFGTKAVYGKRPKQACINAFMNRKGADHRYFLHVDSEPDDVERIAGMTVDSDDEYMMPLEPKSSYVINIDVRNDGKTVAKNVRLKLSKIPKQLKKGETFKLTATITGDNLVKSPVKNTIEFVALKDVSIKLEHSFNGEYNSFDPKMQQADWQYIKSLFSAQGRLVGEPLGEYDQLSHFSHNGIIPAGGKDISQYVRLRVEKLK